MSSNLQGMTGYADGAAAYVYVPGPDGRLELVRFRTVQARGRGGEPSTYIGALAYNPPPHRQPQSRCCCTIL